MEEEKKADENAEAEKAGGSILHSALFKWIIVGVILLVFIGIEVGIAVFFVDKLKEPNEVDLKKQEEEMQEAEKLRKQTEIGATLAKPIEVTVNISGEDGRYLKCGVQLEYDPSDIRLGPELEARNARIKDIILDIMSSRPLSELITNDGKRAIREQIVEEINSILPEMIEGKRLGKVNRSYFDSFMIQ